MPVTVTRELVERFLQLISSENGNTDSENSPLAIVQQIEPRFPEIGEALDLWSKEPELTKIIDKNFLEALLTNFSALVCIRHIYGWTTQKLIKAIKIIQFLSKKSCGPFSPINIADYLQCMSKLEFFGIDFIGSSNQEIFEYLELLKVVPFLNADWFCAQKKESTLASVKQLPKEMVTPAGIKDFFVKITPAFLTAENINIIKDFVAYLKQQDSNGRFDLKIFLGYFPSDAVAQLDPNVQLNVLSNIRRLLSNISRNDSCKNFYQEILNSPACVMCLSGEWFAKKNVAELVTKNYSFEQILFFNILDGGSFHGKTIEDMSKEKDFAKFLADEYEKKLLPEITEDFLVNCQDQVRQYVQSCDKVPTGFDSRVTEIIRSYKAKSRFFHETYEVMRTINAVLYKDTESYAEMDRQIIVCLSDRISQKVEQKIQNQRVGKLYIEFFTETKILSVLGRKVGSVWNQKPRAEKKPLDGEERISMKDQLTEQERGKVYQEFSDCFLKFVDSHKKSMTQLQNEKFIDEFKNYCVQQLQLEKFRPPRQFNPNIWGMMEARNIRSQRSSPSHSLSVTPVGSYTQKIFTPLSSDGLSEQTQSASGASSAHTSGNRDQIPTNTS